MLRTDPPHGLLIYGYLYTYIYIYNSRDHWSPTEGATVVTSVKGQGTRLTNFNNCKRKIRWDTSNWIWFLDNKYTTRHRFLDSVETGKVLPIITICFQVNHLPAPMAGSILYSAVCYIWGYTLHSKSMLQYTVYISQYVIYVVTSIHPFDTVWQCTCYIAMWAIFEVTKSGRTVWCNPIIHLLFTTVCNLFCYYNPTLWHSATIYMLYNTVGNMWGYFPQHITLPHCCDISFI